MKTAARIGFSYSDYLKITPRELHLCCEGYNERKKNDSKEMIYQAYLISRWVWQKNVDIEKILSDKPKEMTDEDIYRELMKLANR